MTARLSIGVLGAGAIGTYIGVELSAQALPVVLIGRPWLLEAQSQLRAITIRGREHRPGSDVRVSTSEQDLSAVDLCIVAVKSKDTEAAAETLARVLPGHVPVISLQNGVRNVARLRAKLGPRVIAGMVTFNVIPKSPGVFVQATSGPILFGRPETDEGLSASSSVIRALRDGGEIADMRDDIESVQLGKLLLNLNNGLCAVTGLPLRSFLADRDLRWCLAACIDEGRRVCARADRKYSSIGILSPGLVASVLRLPNLIFRALARGMIAIDPDAKTSTLVDLERGRSTEIDELNGEIVRLAVEAGTTAPLNHYITRLVHELEGASPIPFVSGRELRATLESIHV